MVEIPGHEINKRSTKNTKKKLLTDNAAHAGAKWSFQSNSYRSRSRLSTEISSSIARQRIPSPPPIRSQFFRSDVDAPSSRGNQLSGTEMIRPSAKPTFNASSANATSTANG